MLDVFVLLDSTNSVKYCSDASSTVLGLHPEELVGQSLPDFLLNKLSQKIAVDSLNPLLELIRGPLDTAASVEVTCSGPQPREYVVTAFPLPATLRGLKKGLTIRDVTEEREIERRRDTLMAALSHELCDPITAMMGFSKLLLEANHVNPTERAWLENIQTCGQRLATIASDMLDLEGIRRGNLAVNSQPVDLRDVVDEVLPLITKIYNRIECSVAMPHDLPVVIGDRARLAQILGNLLSNAVKYSPEGGRVTICAHDEPQEQKVVLAVADQGVGIAPEEMERIFMPFQRSLRPEVQEIKGIGLGLYIVKGLVELMHGELWVDSQVGRGSTFYLALPACPERSVSSRIR